MSQIEEFKQRDFRKEVINIENTAKCTLLCPQCKRTTFLQLNGGSFTGKDLTPEQFRKVVTYFDDVTFGGQLSDPVFGTYFLELLEICHEHKLGPRVLHAATGKSKDWYIKAFETNPNARWTFGIDGPPHLSHKYRINQKGNFLFQIMCMAKKMDMKVCWQYIIFNYNKNYIQRCKQIAKEIDIPIIFIDSRRE